MDAYLQAGKTRLKGLAYNAWFVFIAGALLGGLFFIYFFGIYVLHPMHTDWLLIGGDLKQHYVGWEFYRQANWTFPIGMITGLAHPFGVPITYLDSIPLLAIPLKAVDGLLPTQFQYFGIWGLICYMLQGGFAAMILRHWTKNTAVVLLAAIILIINPIMLSRMFVHTALASHWLILAAILATISWRHIFSGRHQVRYLLTWTVLLVLAVLIHPYFLPMVGLFFFISLVVTYRDIRTTLIQAAVPIITAILIFWAIGGFAIKATVIGGLGEYGLNINSVVNPLGWSRFLPSLQNATASGETLNYLGAGVLLLGLTLLCAALCSLYASYSVRSLYAIRPVSINKRYVLIVLAVLGIIILAISPRIQFGTKIIVDIALPRLLEGGWSIFRASARLFWPVYYLIIIGIIVYLLRLSRKWPPLLLPILLSVLTAVQVIDIQTSPQALERRQTIKSYASTNYKASLSLAEWNKTIGERQHMVYLEPMVSQDFFALSDVAMLHKLTMNTGYYARAPELKIRRYQSEQRQLLIDGQADTASNLYVTKDRKFADQVAAGKEYEVTLVDSYFVIR